jgi:hypothetical protein
VNKSISILLRVCIWLSYAVMLTSGLLQAPGFLIFLLLGGHGLIGRGEADLSQWVYMICTFALPLASACFYFKWPWGPLLVCWIAVAVHFLVANPSPLGDFLQIAFLLAALVGLGSHVIPERSGLWPIKTLRG